MDEMTLEQARQMLEDVDGVSRRTRDRINTKGGDLDFMVWGLIWMLGFGISQVVINRLGASDLTGMIVGGTWLVLVPLGIVVGTVLELRNNPVKDPRGWRLGVFWFLLYGFVNIWLWAIMPFVGVPDPESALTFWRSVALIAATVPMFAYVVMGLWLDHFMLWVGLAVTGLSVAGFFLVPDWFYAWMALFGGGTLLGTGVYSRLKWRGAQ